MSPMYPKKILDHFKNPVHMGSLTAPQNGGKIMQYKAVNALCGDQCEIHYEVKDNCIVNICWKGQGCALSMATCDIVCEYLLNKPISDLSNLSEKKILDILGMTSVVQGREKCILLLVQ